MVETLAFIGNQIAYAFGVFIFLMLAMATLMVGKIALAGWKEWRYACSVPLISASDEILQFIPAQWPLPTERWPSPLPGEGQRMSAPRCAAYARAASMRGQTVRYQAEGLLVLAAAFLGVQLQDVFQSIRKALRSTNSSIVGVADEFPMYLQRPLEIAFLCATLIPVLVVLYVCLSMRKHAERLDTVRRYYEEIAAADALDEFKPIEEQGRRSFFDRWFGPSSRNP